MQIEQVKIGLYTYKLGEDWIAVDETGEPVARAKTKEAVQAAVPDATGYFTSADFQPIADEDNLPNVTTYLNERPTHYGYACLTAEGFVLSSGYLRTEDTVQPPVGTVKRIYLDGGEVVPAPGTIYTRPEGWKVHARALITGEGKMLGIINGGQGGAA